MDNEDHDSVSSLRRELVFNSTDADDLPEVLRLSKGDSRLELTRGDAFYLCWLPECQNSVIFCNKLCFEGKPGIRRGEPVLMPTVAPQESLPNTAHAKDCYWQVKSYDEASSTIVITQRESDLVRDYYNYSFKIDLTMKLLNDAQISLGAVLKNTGQETLAFSWSFYSFFTHRFILDGTLFGLYGCRYMKQVPLQKRKYFKESQLGVKLFDVSRRCYKNTPDLQCVQLQSNLLVKFEKFNLPDMAFYNPSLDSGKLEKNRVRTDGGRNDDLICIETGVRDNVLTVPPKKVRCAELTVTVR